MWFPGGGGPITWQPVTRNDKLTKNCCQEIFFNFQNVQWLALSRKCTVKAWSVELNKNSKTTKNTYLRNHSLNELSKYIFQMNLTLNIKQQIVLFSTDVWKKSYVKNSWGSWRPSHEAWGETTSWRTFCLLRGDHEVEDLLSPGGAPQSRQWSRWANSSRCWLDRYCARQPGHSRKLWFRVPGVRGEPQRSGAAPLVWSPLASWWCLC